MRILNFKTFIVIFLSVCSLQAQNLPRTSPSASVNQTVGLTDVTIKYSRPNVKGRAIFGELVPYGEVWRTGANEATTFEINKDIKVNGQVLKAGKYALFTVPGKDQWKVIFNSQHNQWGAYSYDGSKDVLSFNVKPAKNDFTESFEIKFSGAGAMNGGVDIAWDKTKISFSLESLDIEEATKIVAAKIEAVSGESDPNKKYSPYYQGAQFYNDNKIDAKKALEMAETAVKLREAYWTLKELAKAQADNGKYEAALVSLEKANKLAKKANEEGFVNGNKMLLAEWKGKK
ncbi:DUF2911 domain-containing protein [Fulvivirgaceae bacterium BMA10]|uniref:DUF2911 domain-containing protein n=1 Tax=Splendidivirga corallicola TaxID=3051826 RepID=A0ABT8KQM0_9BACT|nr:DUF2911 domain-containing protein [Fulvivirgaceae bacterium BMA10]